jgi:hypothetical protein
MNENKQIFEFSVQLERKCKIFNELNDYLDDF